MIFKDKLDKIIKKNNSLVCVGLDPEIEKLPIHLKKANDAIFKFNKAIIDTTHDKVCVYKPNIAFYEAYGIEGLKQLQKTITYIQYKYPEIPIILDAKRGDIGNTNAGYVKYSFDYLKVDAVTIQPYLGEQAVRPFLERKEKGIIILCRTSNPGAGEFQDLIVNKVPLYQHVAKKVVNNWNYNNNCLLVIGATYPKELEEIRKIAKTMTFLVPGIGAQGGDLKAILKVGLNTEKKGLIISSSRGIIYASDKEDFAERAREEAEKLKKEINKYR